MKRVRYNSDTETYQFGLDGNVMRFGEPPYSLNRYEQSSNYASDITDKLRFRDRNYCYLIDEIYTFKGPYRI